jgi:hypothetical protein
VSPSVGTTPQNSSLFPVHGIAGDVFKKNMGMAEEANLNSDANPFKFKRNMQDLLITREKERYMKLAKRHGFESSLKDPSMVNLSNQDEMDFKIATMKAKLARRNNSMKSQTVLEKTSDRDLSPSATQKYQSGKILAITNGESMT